MLILGEIADKMPTISEVWWQQGIICDVLCLIIAWHRWLSMAAIPLCIGWTWITHDYLYGRDSTDIHNEMSMVWINHSFYSSFFSILFAMIVLTIQFAVRSKSKHTLRLSAFA